MRFLRTNTAARITVGPFLDKTDGITPEVALTVTSEKLTLMVDDANVPTLVLDAAPTASGGANDMVHVTGDDAGFYDLELAAANLNYLGRAMLSLNDVATHCPVFHEFMILPAVIYDAMVLGTDLLDVSVTQILGTAVTTPATAGILDVNVKNMNNVAATPITTIKAVQGLAVDGVIPTVTNLTNAPTAGDLTATMKTSVTTAATAATPIAASVSGNVVGSVGSVVGAVGSVTGAVGSVTAGVTLAASAVQAIWDALTSALTTVGSIGKLLVDNINAAISSRASQTSVDDVPTNAELTAALATADDAVLTQVALVKAKTDNLPASPANETTLAALVTTVGVAGVGLTAADDAILTAIAALNNLAAGGAMTLTAGERNAIADALRARQMTEGYAADTVAPTVEQMLFMIWSALSEFAIAGTTITSKKLDKSTTSMTHTLDDATTPTSRTRAT